MKKKNISIILVEPEIGENIGAAARALKNMGFSDLRLVKPVKDWEDRAWFMATFARAELKKIQVFDSLEEAVKDRQVLVATTRRKSDFRGFFRPYGEMIQEMRGASERQKIGILFGRESKGLSNADIQRCNWTVTIPTDKKNPSLNLAQAVMVICFSLFAEENEVKALPHEELDFLSKEEINETMSYLRRGLEALEYPGNPDVLNRVIGTFEGIFRRGGMIEREAKMLRSMARRIQERTRPKFAKNFPAAKPLSFISGRESDYF